MNKARSGRPRKLTERVEKVIIPSYSTSKYDVENV